MAKGIDTAQRLSAATAKAVKDAGYTFVGRYLVPNSGSLAWKALTQDEARDISNAGLKILAVWETTANRAAAGGYAGYEDGRKALALAQKFEIPSGAIIYFAVDYEAKGSDLDLIEDYLRAARENTGPYRVGVYGSYTVVEEMHKRGACDGFWQCLAWSYGRLSEHRHIYQGQFEKKVAGISVDINDCPDMTAAGMWDYRQEAVQVVSAAAAAEALMEQLSDEQCYEIVQRAQRHAATLPAPDWATEELAEAVSDGITDGTRPQAAVTRAECAVMAHRARHTGGRKEGAG